jgi:hypothetical protein
VAKHLAAWCLAEFPASVLPNVKEYFLPQNVVAPKTDVMILQLLDQVRRWEDPDNGAPPPRPGKNSVRCSNNSSSSNNINEQDTNLKRVKQT